MIEHKQATVVIPAFRPEPRLVGIVDGLSSLGLADILVVDDGSGHDYGPVFDALAGKPGVEVLRHEVNLGKGAALKTAFHHVLATRPDSIGVVTADADGQHLAHDIQAVAERLQQNPEALILGARRMGRDVPFRSRFGNELTALVFRVLQGKKITDTQTGLRGIPRSFLPRLLQIRSQRYEFELEMLIAAVRGKLAIIEQAITTVYEEGNRSSHFNPLMDSMKIYFVFLRFSFASLLVYFTDLIVFSLSYFLTGGLFSAMVVGRLGGAIVGFLLAKNLVFHYHVNNGQAILRFALVWLALLGISYLAVEGAVGLLGMNVYVARAAIDFLLYFANFMVQQAFVFATGEGKETQVIEG